MAPIDPKTRRQLSRFLAPALAILLLAGCETGPPASPTDARRPNVILIMTDDQGVGDFGVMGNPVLETPNLDALARASASVTDFYVSPVCSPTRASLMTGRYHMRTQCIDTFLGRSRMAPEEVTIAEVLRDAGYSTGIFGKWHLGDNYPRRPSDQGFDEALIHRGGGIGQSSDPREAAGKYTDPILFHNNQPVQGKGYCTDLYFDAAIRFIEQQAEADRPFFTYIATNAPHGPFHDVPEALYQYYLKKDYSPILTLNGRGRPTQNDRMARIAAMIGNIDENIGRLASSLQDRGLLDNTIIVYLNDNGPNSRRYVGDMRGMKTEIYEGGVRSPLWVRWDGVLKPGHSAELVAAHFDLMPTLLDACGVKPPKGIALDGRSILPALKSEKHALADDRPVVIQAHRGDEPSRYNNFMLRQGDWKLLNSTRPWGAQSDNNPTFELYNLADDPDESNNLAAKRPEKLAELRKAYDAWFDDVHASFKKRPFPQPITIDPAHENPAVLTRQDAHNGGWHLSVATPGKYDIRLELGPGQTIDADNWTARLQLGGRLIEKPIAQGAAEIILEAVDLPPGPVELSATRTHPQKKQAGFYHVTLRAR